jgi:hypothetical protein
MKALVPVEIIEKKILLIRGEKVMLDVDLAELYGVETKMLVRAVKRNIDRFPSDFMIQVDREEFENLRFQFGTSSRWGGRRYLPGKKKVTQFVTNCLFASKYKLYLPTEKELKEELEREKRMIEIEIGLRI